MVDLRYYHVFSCLSKRVSGIFEFEFAELLPLQMSLVLRID